MKSWLIKLRKRWLPTVTEQFEQGYSDACLFFGACDHSDLVEYLRGRLAGYDRKKPYWLGFDAYYECEVRGK